MAWHNAPYLVDAHAGQGVEPTDSCNAVHGDMHGSHSHHTPPRHMCITRFPSPQTFPQPRRRVQSAICINIHTYTYTYMCIFPRVLLSRCGCQPTWEYNRALAGARPDAIASSSPPNWGPPAAPAPPPPPPLPPAAAPRGVPGPAAPSSAGSAAAGPPAPAGQHSMVTLVNGQSKCDQLQLPQLCPKGSHFH
jgi:hypothetical protein